MGMEFTSLEDLFPRMRPYDGRMPIRMPNVLQWSVWLTVVIEFFLLGLFAVLPHEFWQVRLHPDGFFRLELVMDVSNSVLELVYLIMPHLVGVNVVSLLLALVSVTVSFGMRRRVRRLFALLMTINLIPSGISIILSVVVATVLAVATTIHAVIWCIGFLLNTLIVIGVVGGFLWFAGRR